MSKGFRDGVTDFDKSFPKRLLKTLITNILSVFGIMAKCSSYGKYVVFMPGVYEA